ncbi:MAG: DNA-binding MarR family transcriptional regulator [Gammaproteobacteria bacterium]|jgi:DNA-binding MarR family transcriptional regulator
MQDPRNVADLVERLNHGAYADENRNGLKPAQWSALRYFANANRFSKTASAFAQYQGITAGAASQTIGGLVKQRLLKRTCDNVDKRRHHLTLTAKAEGLTKTDPISSLVAAASTLEENQRDATALGLSKMLAHLVRERGGVVFGFCDDCQYLRCERRSGRSDSYRCAQAEQLLTEQELNKICINFEADNASD